MEQVSLSCTWSMDCHLAKKPQFLIVALPIGQAGKSSPHNAAFQVAGVGTTLPLNKRWRPSRGKSAAETCPLIFALEMLKPRELRHPRFGSSRQFGVFFLPLLPILGRLKSYQKSAV
jgi:hypothetical protein